MEISDKVEKDIIEFARKNRKIDALCFGEFAGQEDTYIFITDRGYDFELEDRVTDLTIELMQKYDVDVNPIVAPFGRDSIADFEKCLYQRK